MPAVHANVQHGHRSYSGQGVKGPVQERRSSLRCRLAHSVPSSANDAEQVVKRAEDEDLNKDVRYHVAFIKNPQGRVITDVSPTVVSQPMPIDRQLPEMAMPRV